MNSCPESEKIQALRFGSLSAEEARRMQSHIETCPACRQELEVETAIDRELALEIRAPEIEDSVLRGLKILRLAEAESGGHDLYKYLLYAALIVVFGFLVLPYLIHLPPLRIGQLFSPDRLRPLFSIFRSNLSVTIGIGFALLSVSLLFSFPRLRKVFEL